MGLFERHTPGWVAQPHDGFSIPLIEPRQEQCSKMIRARPRNSLHTRVFSRDLFDEDGDF